MNSKKQKLNKTPRLSLFTKGMKSPFIQSFTDCNGMQTMLYGLSDFKVILNSCMKLLDDIFT